MQSQLKVTALSVRVWRALAVTMSASALTLALCAQFLKPRPLTAHTGAAVAAATAPAFAELAPLSRVAALRDSGDDAALEALIGIANRAEPKLRGAALECIAQIGGDRAREFLARRFQAAADADLPELASALATLGDAPSRALLKSAARASRPMARSAAFDALSTLDTADVRDFMVQALGFVDPSFAIGYFLNCRDPRALRALERLARNGDASQQRSAIDALFAQGSSAEPALLRLLREDDELCDALLQGQPPTPLSRQALRRASIERLRAGALTTGWVFEFLQRDLSSEAREALVLAARDPAARDSALSALSARGDIGSLRALSALANDVEQGLAEHAACALLSQPDSRSRPFLLRSNRANLRNEAAAALERINAQGARPI